MFTLPAVILVMPEGKSRSRMEQLYQQNYTMMFAIAWRYVGSGRAEAEDIVSNSCLAIMDCVDVIWNLPENRQKAYVATIVYNAAYDYLLSEKRQADLPKKMRNNIGTEGFIIDDFEQKIDLEHELEWVIRAIRQLPDKEQIILRMKFFQKKSDEEIAHAAGISVNSLRQYISRARKRLKQALYKE